ncbi:hypothetical protein [Mucilaginibacter polytrichastri]|uniref:Uncharacterized protein n=1 Tax=Mucilaginibacter polytrichastri TaxID=1302689 RepID=A0A1Q5ZWP7_9SPHI|nr:hypothetical protein [Mucilaginibacter polytrichastri]OKS86176.1 hypothetical protein RG47T_1627 [Mucilaginibacter polytrichastri]SFT15643.1 hypothetical protein SAMN04487890_11337 [Mucilaginibacter polytrichastri]
MKKLLVIALCFLITSCGKYVGDNALQRFVKSSLKDKKQGTLKLSAYNEVQWDKVYILGPYTNKKNLDADLKAYYTDIIESEVESDDQVCFVMLYKGKELVGKATFNRRYYDLEALTKFTTNAKIAPYSKEDANFPFADVKNIYIIRQR